MPNQNCLSKIDHLTPSSLNKQLMCLKDQGERFFICVISVGLLAPPLKVLGWGALGDSAPSQDAAQLMLWNKCLPSGRCRP